MFYFQVWLICLTATREFQLSNLHVLSIFTLFHMRHPVKTEKKGKKNSKYVASLKSCVKIVIFTAQIHTLLTIIVADFHD